MNLGPRADDLVRKSVFLPIFFSSTPSYGHEWRSRLTVSYEHPAGNWEGNLRAALVLSGINPIGTVPAEHLEDDAAEVSVEGAYGFIVFLAF